MAWLGWFKHRGREGIHCRDILKDSAIVWTLMCLFGMGGKIQRCQGTFPGLLSMHLDRVVPFTALWLRNSSNIGAAERKGQRRAERERGIKAESQTEGHLSLCQVMIAHHIG